MILGKRKSDPGPGHEYPTRWKLRRHNSLSQASKVENCAEDQVLVACKRRKGGERRAFYLPKEIIFHILLLIPAQVLHEVVRYVCKQWNGIVSDPLFIKMHSQMSSAGFLIQDHHKNLQAYYTVLKSATSEVTEIPLPFPARILGSFNGLVLLRDLRNLKKFHVMNLVTKEKISLPPLVRRLNLMNGVTGFALDSSGHYKVVHVFGNARYVQFHMRMVTVGIDKAWRFIDLQDIPMNSANEYAFLYPPFVIGRFIYWYHFIGHFGFAMDVDTETIYKFPAPYKKTNATRYNFGAWFFGMGTHLALIKADLDIWRVWKLIDVKSGQWTEVAGINVRAMFRRVDEIFYPRKCSFFSPVSLINEDFWFYRYVDKEYVVVRYNLSSGRFVYFPVKSISESTLLHPHVHTLLSPKNTKELLGVAR